MITGHFAQRPASGASYLARVNPNRAGRLPAAPTLRAVRRPLRMPVCAAKQPSSVFETARREMNMQVMNAHGPAEVAWAIKLRAALGTYLGMEEALDAQRASPERVQGALADVLAMAQGPGVRLPANLSDNPAKSQMWQALLVAGRLRRCELESVRHTALPPRLPSPYIAAPTWPFFVRLLEGMRHKAWPPDVRAWLTALIPAIETYLLAEERFAVHAPNAAAVAKLREVVADALQKIDPPPYRQTRDVPLRVQLHWKTESTKRMLTDTVALCRCTLLLRRGELAQMAEALGSRDADERPV